MFRRIRLLLELTKVRISLFATLSASTGFILAKQGVSGEIVVPTLGIFFLACGSCALNQYQERNIDKRMERTRGRPLPSGRLNPCAALWMSVGLILAGFFILFFGTRWVACLLGLSAIFWYNGVYTYLKQRTPFAAIPGALVGVIPPVLGWMSGGGTLFDPRIGAVAFFFFIWQVPHFWLLLLDCAEDYEKAGLPSLTKIFTAKQLKRIIFIWILSTAVSCLLIPLFGSVNFIIHLFLIVAAFWLVWNAINLFRSHAEGPLLRFAFMRLNIYALIVIVLLSFDKLLNPGYPELNLISKALAIILNFA